MTSNCLKKREDVIANFAINEKIDYFSFNNRGNGVITYSKISVGEDTKKQTVGTAFEDVEDSYYDILGALIELKKHGYEEIYLQGHSLGCTKIVYTYNKLKKENSEFIKNIKGVILLSLVDVPKAQKVYLQNKYDDIMNIAIKNEKEGKLDQLMPRDAFVHYMSTKTYLRCFRDCQNIDFARYYDETYTFPELNNIKIPLFMRWGNVHELIEQDASELASMMNKKIQNDCKDIGYIDGADHGYTGKYDVLAEQIMVFLKNVNNNRRY